MNAQRVWRLAHIMYDAYCLWQMQETNTAHPSWQYLREDVKEKFLSMAEVLLLEERSEEDPMPEGYLNTDESLIGPLLAAGLRS